MKLNAIDFNSTVTAHYRVIAHGQNLQVRALAARVLSFYASRQQ
jgi:hypothetical protein